MNTLITANKLDNNLSLQVNDHDDDNKMMMMEHDDRDDDDQSIAGICLRPRQCDPMVRPLAQ